MKEVFDFRKFKENFLFIPVGGCNFIGTNFYLYHFDGIWIAVDCGIGIADKRCTPGVDILIPDCSVLNRFNIKVSAIIITHSHEDHIGAICDVYHYFKCPVYVSKFAKNFLEVDMLENEMAGQVKLIEVDSTKRKPIQIGKFSIEMVQLTHSMVESCGLVIKTPIATVFHTGDWNIDEAPIIGNKMDIARLKELGEKCEISTLICDSTNCLKEGVTRSESELGDSLFEIIKEKKGAVVITTFASSLSRMQSAYNVAKKTGRKLFLSGHAMHRLFAIAQKSGYLLDIECHDLKEVRNAKRSEVLILATGCQGEPMATMAKLANNKHNFFKLQKGDSVVFSSMVIPGNEVEVSDIVDKFIERNIEVITNKDYFVHVSGHPYRGDLRKMYSWLKPRSIIPMHGNWLMLSEHAKFAKECGIKNSLMSVNGSVISITDDNIELVGKIQDIKSICIDGNRHVADDNKIFSDRIALSQNGLVNCVVVVNQKGGIVCKPEINAVGLFDYKHKEDLKFIQKLEKQVESAIKPSFFSTKKAPSAIELQKIIYQLLKSELHKGTKKLPMISVFAKVI